MTKKHDRGGVDDVRRKLLRTSVVLGGAFAAGQIPYSRPEIKSFFGIRSAYAQPSVVYSISCSFEVSLPVPPSPGQACQNAVIQNVVAQVTPVPLAGTVLQCTPTTDDPLNSTLPNFSSTTVPTDAAGMVSFASLDLIGNVPNPPLAIGSILTMTVTFQDTATFGSAFCSNDLEIIASC